MSNLVGLIVVVMFVLVVDWSLWVSIPVGIVIAMIISFIFGAFRQKMRYIK